MAETKPAGARLTLSETLGGLEVTIPSNKNYAVIIFLGVWLFFWTMGEGAALEEIFKDNVKIGLLIWLVLWTAAGVVALYFLLLNVAGKEIITVSNLNLSIKNDFFGYGRVMDFDMSRVADLRVSRQITDDSESYSGIPSGDIGRGNIAFDYDGKTYRFGADISTDEADRILDRITEYRKLHPVMIKNSSLSGTCR